MRYPIYNEPSIEKNRARLEIIAPPGVNASVSSYPDSDNICIDRERKDGYSYPIHLDTSGFAGKSKKRIGMPQRDLLSVLSGSEFYISSSEPIAFLLEFAGNSQYEYLSCTIALRFTFIKDRDYRLFMHPAGCQVNISDITDYKDGDKLQNINYERLIVKGSKAWTTICKK